MVRQEKAKVDNNDTWDRLWSQRMRIKPGGVRTTLYNRFIFSRLSIIVPLKGLNVVEFGAGSGKLSYLLFSLGNAKQVRMVDRSTKAIEYSKYLFNSLTGA